jgi:hypothetical protein
LNVSLMLCHPAGSSESAVPFKKLPAGAQSLYVVSSLRENDERTGQLVSSRSPYGVSVQQWLNSKMVGQEAENEVKRSGHRE